MPLCSNELVLKPFSRLFLKPFSWLFSRLFSGPSFSRYLQCLTQSRPHFPSLHVAEKNIFCIWRIQMRKKSRILTAAPKNYSGTPESWLFKNFLVYRVIFHKWKIVTLVALTSRPKASNGQWFSCPALLFSVFMGESRAAAPIGDEVL